MKSKNEITYLIAFALYCFMALSGGSELIILSDTIKIAIYAIIIVLFVIKIMTQKLSIKEIVIYVVIGCISLYAYIKLEITFFLLNLLAIIALKNVNIKNVVKIDIIMKILFLTTHSVLYGIDYLFDYDKIQDLIINNDGRRIRHALYFTHPNIVNEIMFWLIMDILYLKENIKLRHILMSSIMILIMYSVTKSRTMLYIFGIFILIYYLKNIIKNKKIYYKLIYVVQKYIIEILTIFSIFISMAYKNMIYFVTTFLNALTSGRVYYSYIALRDFGINWICNEDALIFEKYLLLDNFYIRCAILYGLVFIVLIALMTKLVKKEEDRVLDEIMFIILAISLFSEYSGIIIGNAIPLLLLGNMIINKKSELIT